jgi:hypothetical protein
MMNEHPFHQQKLEVSNTLHEKLMQAPMHAKKLKRRNTLFTLATIVCVVVNLSYLSLRQEKLTEEQLLETHHANFGSTLSI